MLEKVRTFFIDAGHAISDNARKLGDKIKDGYEYLGRRVTVITNKHLPPRLAQAAQESYYGAPYSTSLMPFAAVGLGPLAASVALVATKAFEHRLDPTTAKRMYHGIRSFSASGAVFNTAKAIAFLNPVFLAYTVSYALTGLLAHHLAKDVAAKEVAARV